MTVLLGAPLLLSIHPLDFRRASLSRALVVTARRWAAVVAPEETDRLTPVVESLSQRCVGTAREFRDFAGEGPELSDWHFCPPHCRYLGPDYSDPGKRGVVGSITAPDIPGVARQSFPLCMLTMYQALHESHHLKHDGRMQFGLFLKVGVCCSGSVFDAVTLCPALACGIMLRLTCPLQGIGLPLEEAIRFWRTEMAPVRNGGVVTA